MGTITSMGLSSHIVDFMQNILGLCDGSAYKAMAVQASAPEKQLKPLKTNLGVEPLPAKTGL